MSRRAGSRLSPKSRAGARPPRLALTAREFGAPGGGAHPSAAKIPRLIASRVVRLRNSPFLLLRAQTVLAVLLRPRPGSARHDGNPSCRRPAHLAAVSGIAAKSRADERLEPKRSQSAAGPCRSVALHGSSRPVRRIEESVFMECCAGGESARRALRYRGASARGLTPAHCRHGLPPTEEIRRACPRYCQAQYCARRGFECYSTS